MQVLQRVVPHDERRIVYDRVKLDNRTSVLVLHDEWLHEFNAANEVVQEARCEVQPLRIFSCLGVAHSDQRSRLSLEIWSRKNVSELTWQVSLVECIKHVDLIDDLVPLVCYIQTSLDLEVRCTR